MPNFLIDKNLNTEDLSTLLEGLRLVGDFLDKTILKPNNLTLFLKFLSFMSFFILLNSRRLTIAGVLFWMRQRMLLENLERTSLRKKFNFFLLD